MAEPEDTKGASTAGSRRGAVGAAAALSVLGGLSSLRSRHGANASKAQGMDDSQILSMYELALVGGSCGFEAA